MTALAPGSSSTVALLNPVNPPIATISMRSRQVSGWEASQVLKTRLDQSGTISKSREGPRRSRTGVTSKMTVTYLSPYGVWRHPQGLCAKRLTTVSREMPWHPQRRHHWSSPVIRHANTAWSGFDALTRHLQPQTIKAREHAQIRAIKDSICRLLLWGSPRRRITFR